MGDSFERIIKNLISEDETPLFTSRDELFSIRFYVEGYEEQFKKFAESDNEWFRCHWAILTFLEAVIIAELFLYEFEINYIIAQAHSKHLFLQGKAINILDSLDNPYFLDEIEDVKVPNYYIQMSLDKMRQDWRERLNG